MKKFFAALAVTLVLAGSNVEAAEFTQAQLDKIFLSVGQAESSAAFDLNAEKLKERFNGLITPILREATGSDDVSAMAHLFLIKDYKIFSGANGDTFANIFGDYRVALVGTSTANGNFKSLNLCYTTPENSDEAIFTIWLLTAFVKSIAPEVNPQTLMNELTAENSSGSVVTSGVKFSIAEDGNLNILTATIP